MIADHPAVPRSASRSADHRRHFLIRPTYSHDELLRPDCSHPLRPLPQHAPSPLPRIPISDDFASLLNQYSTTGEDAVPSSAAPYLGITQHAPSTAQDLAARILYGITHNYGVPQSLDTHEDTPPA